MPIVTEIKCDNPACGGRDDWPAPTGERSWLLVHITTPAPTRYQPDDPIRGEHAFCGWSCLSAWVTNV